MQEYELRDDEMMDEDGFDPDEVTSRRQQPKPTARRGQKPIENADQIPLFQVLSDLTL